MSVGEMLVLSGLDVEELLAGREQEVVEAVERAYLAHGAGRSALPHSSFLRFPDDEVNRIIALPAFLGDGFEVAGLKWISSFPGNVKQGLARASAVLVLNDCADGRPQAFLEASLISSQRTAASAALGARELLSGGRPARTGLIGCGLINFEVARFTHALCGAERFLLFDLDAERAERTAARLRERLGVDAQVAGAAAEVLAACPLISFATTAIRPHVDSLSPCQPGAVILHVSLRDLAPAVLLDCDNVVDDADHVCRAQTSVHLAEQLTGGRSFLRCALADILAGRAPRRRGDGAIAVFSPFGLGVLDIAVGKLVVEAALAEGRGTRIASFFPRSADALA